MLREETRRGAFPGIDVQVCVKRVAFCGMCQNALRAKRNGSPGPRRASQGSAGTGHAQCRVVKDDACETCSEAISGWKLTAKEGLRILVAEDDREMNAVLAEALTAEGHTVVAVESGTDALAVLFNTAGGVMPEAAVMDVRMPGLSGIQVLAALRRSSSTLPVVMITAFGEESVHREAIALGAYAVLDKPFDLDALCTLVAEIRLREQQRPAP